MIRIEINDVSQLDKHTLYQTALFLMSLTGEKLPPTYERTSTTTDIIFPEPILFRLFPSPPRLKGPAQVELDSEGLPWDMRIHARNQY